MIRFFNTLSGKKEIIRPLLPGEVRLYTCGPTVYDYAHIGNFRAYVFEDLLKRFLLSMGFKVTHVMNITDVDDKTIKGARAKGISLDEYTRTYIDAFFKDIKTLNIALADHYPRATQHIPEMVALVKGLLEKGYAYEKEGSYYFSIAKFPSYGQLSKINLEELQPGQRVEADEYEKQSAHDFALWKKNKEGEPFWDSKLGPGRPGWHIECSAMSSKYLGQTFDIHCGGVDNIFPHHENEIAQSEAFSGTKFVNTWLHCHHLIVDGEKMSKSKGNQYTLDDLRQKNVDPLALRFLLLSTHYRKTLNFTFEALAQANASLQRISDFVYELENRTFPEGEGQSAARMIKAAEQKFTAGLSDDLNISVSMTALFDLIKKANILMSRGRLKKREAESLLTFIRSVNKVLAVLAPKEGGILSILVLKSIAAGEKSGLPSDLFLEEKVLKKIAARQSARQEKNFQLADQIRRELQQEGILLEDTKDGVRWKSVPKPRQHE